MAVELLVAEVMRRYGFSDIDQVDDLGGGEWKQLWRCTSNGEHYVISVSHPTTTEASLAYEHRLLRFLHAEVAQIPAPIVAQDGATYFRAADAFVALLPWLPGRMAEEPEDAVAAMHFLAHFQQVAARYPTTDARPNVPAWQQWDWHAPTWPTIERMLEAQPQATDPVGRRFWQACGEWAPEIVARRRQISEERLYFQRWLQGLTHAKHPLQHGLIHDDYHGNNLLIDKGKITALLDWDGCHPDWMLFDLSNALWEFCSDDETHVIVSQDVQLFLGEYATAGGSVPEQEYGLIIPAIRCRRLIEILGSLHGIATGTAWDESPDYLVHNLHSLENLRGTTL